MLELVFTPALMRGVFVRPETNDRQVWADTFTGLYHLPPASMPTPRTVLDLGSNIGLTVAHYARLWPLAEIVAVEMDEENAALIARNAPGVRVAPFAVSHRAGLASYESSAASDAYTLGGSLGSPTVTVVRSRTLRQIILRNFADVEERGVDFVKVDIEGAEWGLLNAPDWAPLVRHLLVELHQEPGYPIGGADVSGELVRRATSRLEAAGFRAVVRHDPHPQAVFATR